MSLRDIILSDISDHELRKAFRAGWRPHDYQCIEIWGDHSWTNPRYEPVTDLRYYSQLTNHPTNKPAPLQCWKLRGCVRCGTVERQAIGFTA